MTQLKPACSFIAALVLALPGAAAVAQDKAESPAIRIYDPGELTLDRYTVIKRIWAGTWRASFWVHTHSDVSAAIEALKSAAASAGADGVVNLHCLSDRGWSDEYFCYGLAIKLKEPPTASWQPPERADPDPSAP